MESDPKLSVLVPVKVTEETDERLTKAAGGKRKRAEFIRQGIELRIAQAKEESNGKVTREEIKAVCEAKKLGIDPVATLRERIAQVSTP